MKVSIIGAGNVATHLALALHRCSVDIDFVYSRTATSAKLLANKVNANYSADISLLPVDSAIYFIAIPDQALPELLEQCDWGDRFLVHTSGTMALDILAEYTPFSGVCYPLQTFSKIKQLNFETIPLFIEASDDKHLDFLNHLSSKLSKKVYSVSTEQRRILHLAAVFACNFTNYLFSVSDAILSKGNFPFDVLSPIIEETINKSKIFPPREVQTGPACRKDFNVMQMHLDYLEEFPQWCHVYELISHNIISEQDEKF